MIMCILIFDFICIYLGTKFDMKVDFVHLAETMVGIAEAKNSCPSNPDIALDYKTLLEYGNYNSFFMNIKVDLEG